MPRCVPVGRRVRRPGRRRRSRRARRALRPFGRIRRGADIRVDGLGLPMTRRLIELHGGRLLIDSVRGRGTAITLRFPPRRLRRDGAAMAAVETILIETPRHIAV